MKVENLEFFPTDRALCLANQDDDSKESKLDEVMKAVNDIRKAQIKEAMQRRRHNERLRMVKWQEMYSRNKKASTNSSLKSDKDTSLD